MSDVLETLREVDQHFQKLTRLDVPGQFKRVRKLVDGETKEVSEYTEHYDLWRRVRAAIKELER